MAKWEKEAADQDNDFWFKEVPGMTLSIGRYRIGNRYRFTWFADNAGGQIGEANARSFRDAKKAAEKFARQWEADLRADESGEYAGRQENPHDPREEVDLSKMRAECDRYAHPLFTVDGGTFKVYKKGRMFEVLFTGRFSHNGMAVTGRTLESAIRKARAYRSKAW